MRFTNMVEQVRADLALVVVLVGCGGAVDETTQLPQVVPASIPSSVAGGGTSLSPEPVPSTGGSAGSYTPTLPASGAGGALNTAGTGGAPAAGGFSGGGHTGGAAASAGGGVAAFAGAGGDQGTPAELDPCTPPAGSDGTVCGNACGYSLESHPEGYGYPSLYDGLCTCAPKYVGLLPSWVDLRGDTESCAAENLGDPAPRVNYLLDGDQCVQVNVPWAGWWMRMHRGAEYTQQLGGCVKFAGTDNIPGQDPLLIEVFAPAGEDGWVQVTTAPCDGQVPGTFAACLTAP